VPYSMLLTTFIAHNVGLSTSSPPALTLPVPAFLYCITSFVLYKMLSTEGGVMAKKPIILSSEISPAPALVRAGMNVLAVAAFRLRACK
jgi:hypothetical protein